jgi:hypothetical protein
MVFTPRKRAAPTATFDNTWNETDAAFLDPNTLPVAKIPRGWERKQEVKRVGEGKEKKIWRRFDLRSRADDTTQGSEDEEEQDARSRPVKRRQHMSPKAMEKSTSRLGKKRVFKATRWDRRKSVLPSRVTKCNTIAFTDWFQGRKRHRLNIPQSAPTTKSAAKRKKTVPTTWKTRRASTRQTRIWMNRWKQFETYLL